MERILAILNRVETAPATLLTAGRLHAKLATSSVDVLHPRPEIDPTFLPTEEVWTDERSRAFNAQRAGLMQRLEAAVADWQVQQPQPVEQSLRVVVGKVEDTIRAEAAVFDVVVLGSAGAHHDFEAKQAIQTSLLDTTTPILLVPERIPSSLGHRVAIAWEKSQAAEEAIEAALPLLLSADEVAVLIAEEGHHRASLPTGILQSLEQRGTPTDIVRFRLNDRDIGTSLLDEANAGGADLLVMGAFTHNRVMEALFGGATRQVLAGANLPVLMHH